MNDLKAREHVIVPPVVEAQVYYLTTGIKVEREGGVVTIYRGQLQILRLTELEARQIEASLRLLSNAR